MFRLNCNGKLLDLSKPAVMGILNITPDSFFDGGSFVSTDAQLKRAEQMLSDGASIIDIGAVSTRPGAADVCQASELDRLIPAISAIRQHFPEAIISADTFRPLTARAAVEHGADMINDIYGGRFDAGMIETIAALKVSYVMMHMKGEPRDMQHNPEYSDIVAEVTYFFEKQVAEAREKGIHSIIIDPGFGFGKTTGHGYRLLNGLDSFAFFNLPLLVGISRKSMIYSILRTGPEDSLNGTSVLNTVALLKGANILRVHDIREAGQVIMLVEALTEFSGNIK